MSSENLELVRSIYADWERGDFGRSNWADPQMEYVIADGPSPGRWTGPAEAWRAWSDVLSAWEDFTQKAEEFRELDSECILVLTRATAQGKGSGIELSRMWAKSAAVFHLRDHRVMRLVVYFDRDRALADLGLSAEDESS